MDAATMPNSGRGQRPGVLRERGCARDGHGDGRRGRARLRVRLRGDRDLTSARGALRPLAGPILPYAVAVPAFTAKPNRHKAPLLSAGGWALGAGRPGNESGPYRKRIAVGRQLGPPVL